MATIQKIQTQETMEKAWPATSIDININTKAGYPCVEVHVVHLVGSNGYRTL